jgi:NtrC-family two-component system sensor histidine kinase KinB
VSLGCVPSVPSVQPPTSPGRPSRTWRRGFPYYEQQPGKAVEPPERRQKERPAIHTTLQTRFLVSGSLCAATIIALGAWSALTFARLSAAADNALRATQEKLDLTAELAGSLEREDDALLLALTGDRQRGQRELAAERERGQSAYRRLRGVLEATGASDGLAERLGQEIDAYQSAGSALVEGRPPDALSRYQQQINPLLRQAVATCARLREENIDSLRRAGVRARDQAGQATWAVAGASLGALVIAILVSVWMARSVLVPVRALTDSVEAVRRGNFDQRVSITRADELGELAAGFNRMAETLADYRQCSLGELLAAKMTLEATLNALPDAVLVVAPDRTLEAMNPPGRALLQALGPPGVRTLPELPLPPGHRSAVESALAGQTCLPTRTDFKQALTTTLDGQPRRFLLSAVPIPEFLPRQFGAVVVLEDVTDFARLDELRSELIGLASHELKSPLTSLQLNLMLLSEEAIQLPAGQRELLEAALLGCQELGNTINEFLDITRVESGELHLERSAVDLGSLLDETRRSLRTRFAETGVNVQVEQTVEPAVVKGDKARLAHVLTNLLTNALKYSPRGGTVTARLSSETSPAGQPVGFRVSVADEGPGVPPEFRERIFEKFFRVEHHRSGPGRVRGTGIGLYLSREIVRAHGGTIRCEAGPSGVGARLTFTLPAE